MNLHRLNMLLILLAILMLFMGQGWADSWQHSVSSRFTAEHDSNPASSSTDYGDVWRAIFEPSYALAGTVGANELKVGVGVLLERSSDTSLSQDRNDPRASLDWLLRSELGAFGVSAKYVQFATRNATLDAIGQVPVDGSISTRTLSGSWSKPVIERITLAADGTYEDVSYKGGNYTDYSTRSGNLRVSYAFSESSTSLLRGRGMEYVPSDGGAATYLREVAAGLIWKAQEYLDFSLEVGKTKTTNVRTRTNGAASVKYTGQRSDLLLSAGRQVSPSGQGGYVQSQQIKGNWSYSLSELSKIGVDREMWNNLTTNIDARTITGAWFQHSLNPLWETRTYYQHIIREGAGTDIAATNIIGIFFLYTKADF